MLQGTDVSQRVEYVSKEDKSDPKTVFVLKPLNALESMEVLSKIDTQGGTLTPEYVAALLGKTLVEIKNPDLKETDKISDFILSLPFTILIELVTEANSLNKLSEQEIKN